MLHITVCLSKSEIFWNTMWKLLYKIDGRGVNLGGWIRTEMIYLTIRPFDSDPTASQTHDLLVIHCFLGNISENCNVAAKLGENGLTSKPLRHRATLNTSVLYGQVKLMSVIRERSTNVCCRHWETLWDRTRWPSVTVRASADNLTMTT